VVEKLRAAWIKISIAGVLRLRATRAVSRDQSVMRCALRVCNFIGFAKKSMLKIKSLRASKIAKNQKNHNLSG
jgi:hypothetical protein